MRPIVIVLVAGGCLILGWLVADARAATPIERAAVIANHLPRNGELYTGRFGSCRWQARIFRDGHGYAGVICGGSALVSFRDSRGRWGRTS